MKGKYGTSMRAVRRKPRPLRNPYGIPRAGVVKITQADGTVTYQKPYKRGAAGLIVKKGKLK